MAAILDKNPGGDWLFPGRLYCRYISNRGDWRRLGINVPGLGKEKRLYLGDPRLLFKASICTSRRVAEILRKVFTAAHLEGYGLKHIRNQHERNDNRQSMYFYSKEQLLRSVRHPSRVRLGFFCDSVSLACPDSIEVIIGGRSFVQGSLGAELDGPGEEP